MRILLPLCLVSSQSAPVAAQHRRSHEKHFMPFFSGRFRGNEKRHNMHSPVC